jgi:uncharacterized protein YbaR (Trm112 family)/SAM-dependent methyltransferase
VNELLACPVTRLPLKETDWQSALAALSSNSVQLARGGNATNEAADRVLLREDNGGAYPVVGGIPILMAPEMRVPRDRAVSIDINADPYREAYEEMDYYNTQAARKQLDVTQSDAYHFVKQAVDAGEFLQPGWLEATYDVASQADAYRHVAPLEGTRVLLLGGTGIHGVKFLIAGAREVWLATPMLGEAIFAHELAAAFGLRERLNGVVGIAEELPFRDGSFDRVFASACIHHTITHLAFPEIKRVLRSGGRFATFEPWRGPLYGIGTKVLGKRERGVNCRPMEPTRVESLFRTFKSAQVMHHGTFTRYPLLALSKFGVRVKAKTVERITALDDRIASVNPSLKNQGSSVALLATKD